MRSDDTGKYKTLHLKWVQSSKNFLFEMLLGNEEMGKCFEMDAE